MRKIFSRHGAGYWGWAKPILFLLLSTLALLLCLFPLTLEAMPSKSPDSLNLWLDYACFRNLPDTNQSYVEIYYSFNRRELKFTQEEETYQAKFFLNLAIEDKLGNLLENRMWNRRCKVNRWEETQADYMILDKAEILLEPGDYLLKLSVTDLVSECQGEISLELKAKAFGEKNLQLSDLELAFQIEPDTSVGMFTKAGRKILPNPWGAFTGRSEMIYFYAELYNLAIFPGANPDYLLSFTILDSSGRRVKDFGTQTRKKPGNSAVVLSGINISTIPQGNYILQVEAQDKETSQKAFATKSFTILSEEVEKRGSLTSLEEVEKFKHDVTYIATAGELDMFDQLTLEGKKRFVEEFWRKRDPNPDTPINEFKIEHYRRINYANLNFSRTKEANDGWHTDMGRIYILYGEPSEIERNPLTMESKPWEQWNYDELEGGVYFIFIDEDGYGVYRLVHTNL
ncbi:MAG: GWxTD domain-containing protein, partial [Candidatus Zixiibacteriota bacterium]